MLSISASLELLMIDNGKTLCSLVHINTSLEQISQLVNALGTCSYSSCNLECHPSNCLRCSDHLHIQVLTKTRVGPSESAALFQLPSTPFIHPPATPLRTS